MQHCPRPLPPRPQEASPVLPTPEATPGVTQIRDSNLYKASTPADFHYSLIFNPKQMLRIVSFILFTSIASTSSAFLSAEVPRASTMLPGCAGHLHSHAEETPPWLQGSASLRDCTLSRQPEQGCGCARRRGAAVAASQGCQPPAAAEPARTDRLHLFSGSSWLESVLCHGQSPGDRAHSSRARGFGTPWLRREVSTGIPYIPLPFLSFSLREREQWSR